VPPCIFLFEPTKKKRKKQNKNNRANVAGLFAPARAVLQNTFYTIVRILYEACFLYAFYKQRREDENIRILSGIDIGAK
jgi:transposase